MNECKPVELNIFFSIVLKTRHRWRAFMRRQKHPFLRKLYAKDKHRWIPKPKGVVAVPTLYGFKIIINADSDTIQGRSIYYDGTYEAGTLYIMSQCLSEGTVFLDIGSNIGMMALYGAKCVGTAGKVLAFEPEPNTHQKLTANIELNAIKNIELFQTALGNADSTATIYNSVDNIGAASLIKSDELTGHSSTVTIRRLDDLLSEHKIESVRMIKVDVEGWELEVLKGCPNLLSGKDAPIICIEISNLHPTHMGTTEDIYEFITKINNYKIYRLASSKAAPSKLIEITSPADLPRHDNVFCFLPDQKKQLNSSMFIQE